jgi:c-di-GMP-binding flagellar brake protein YcgR
MTAEQRKSPRVESPNLLTYVCLDQDENRVGQGMGRTLNVSEGGILLETHIAIDPQYVVLLDIALEDDLMQFKGKIAHTKKREDGKIESGVAFIEMDEEKTQFLRQYVAIFLAGEKET